MRRSRRLLAALAVVCTIARAAEMKEVSTIPVHGYQNSRFTSPNGIWKFIVKRSGNEDNDATMWLVEGSDSRKVFIGHLPRDAEFAWCPASQCLLVVEQPSIEDSRLLLYRLATGAERVPGVDAVIRKGIERSIGDGSRILFYNVRPLKWMDESHVLIAAQARYLKKGTNAPAKLFTEGYVVELGNGTVVQRVPAADLESKYGFTGRMTDLRLPGLPFLVFTSFD